MGEHNSDITPNESTPPGPGASEPILELHGVYKRFGPLEVLKGIDLAIAPGKTLVILGASGSGKSVMLKILIGLLKPDRGEVCFHGRRIDDLREHDLVDARGRMGFVFQMGALFDSLSVTENIAFPLREQRNLSDAEIERIVRDKLRSVGLDRLGPEFPTQISGGQRKRVAIARALVTDPEVVFFDEPTTGLDPIRADVMNELVIKLRNELHVTAVVVTHDMASAYKIADRIVMLHEGRLIFDGTAEQIRSSADQRVRDFVEGRASASDLETIKTRR